MDDSNSDIVFRPSPEYVRQCALAMNRDLKIKRGAWNRVPIGQTECLTRNARIRLAISSFFSSKAKWPASSRWISASGRSRLNPSAPAAMNEGSLRPQTTKVGGLRWRNHSCQAGYEATFVR